MRLVRGSPAFHHFAVFIKDGQLCPRQLLPGNIRFGNLHLCHIILHFNLLHLSSILYGKGNALSGHIAIGRQRFSQNIFLSYNQLFNPVRFLTGSPFVYYLALAVCHFQLRPRQLLSVCQICFCDLHLCHIILHFNLLHLGSILNGKGNAFCSGIPIGRKHLCHGVFLTNSQFLDDMRLFSRYPFIHYLTALVRNLQLCALNLLTVNQGCFGKFKYRRLVLKSKLIGYGFLLGILIGKSKLLRLRYCGESRCRDSFFYRIGKSNRQICRKGQLPVFVGCLFLNDGSRFHNHFAVLVGDVLLCDQCKDCTLQYTVRILLPFQHGHFHLLAVVLPVRGIGHLRRMLVTVGQVNLPDFPVQYITFRCLLFLHKIFSKRQVPQACNPGIIRGDLCDQLVLFIVVCTFPVSGFDILQSVHFKGDVLQGT